MSNYIQSPLSGINSKLIKTIFTSFIIEGYQKTFGIDVAQYFHNLDKIYLYECPITGYKFFYPFSIAGDEKFYQQLMNFDWYYMPWKWEHNQVYKLIKPGFKVLEVGAGKGDFLKKVKNTIKNVQVLGLELNKAAIAQNPDILLNETVEQHALKFQNHYDLICSFQVLEHIYNVRDFIQAQIKLLKPNGLLIFSVPNNSSFIKFDNNDFLNMPPHHMGLWTPNSLKKLTKLFPIKLIKILREPLQQYHYKWYITILSKKIREFNSIFYFHIYKKLNLRQTFEKLLPFFAKFIPGHTVLAIFKKL